MTVIILRAVLQVLAVRTARTRRTCDVTCLDFTHWRMVYCNSLDILIILYTLSFTAAYVIILMAFNRKMYTISALNYIHDPKHHASIDPRGTIDTDLAVDSRIVVLNASMSHCRSVA